MLFMVGGIVAVKDFSDNSEYFYSYPNHFHNVTALLGVSKEQHAKEKGKKLDKDGQPVYKPGTVPVKIYIGESGEGDRNACIVALKPYKGKLRTMNTGLRGTIKELTVDRAKKLVACLVVTPQNTHVVIFNYRK